MHEPGFFAHHGFWAPGVRLFRTLSFRAKALWISLLFLVPLFAMGSAYLRQAWSVQVAVQREQAGIAFGKEVLALTALIQQQRLHAVQRAASGEARPVDDAARAQLQRVRDARAMLAVPIEAVDLVAANMDKAAAPGNPLASYKRQTQAVEAAQALLAKAIESAGLVNDPELDTRYLVEVGLKDLPQVTAAALAQADVAWAANAGAPAALVTAQITPQRAIGLYLDARVREGLDVVIALDPGRASPLAYAAMQDAIGKVVDATTGAGEEGWKPDATALAAARAGVVERSSALQSHVLAALEARLAERVRAMLIERNLILALLAVSLALAAYMFFAFARVMQGGLNEVRRHLRAMTDGDLTTSPNPWGRDEAAQLMLTLREMQAALRGIVAQVRESCEGIGDASHRLASGASQLAGSADRNAASLQQSSDAMERIGATVRATAQGAGQARDIGRDNVEAAARGGEVIEQVIATMREIHGSSNKIGEITGVIDGIAFQTNILALNAAVEAARAGESGRGFAVVASEVRALAQRSADAAREIKALVGSTVEQIGAGTTVVQRAGQVIAEIVNASRQVEHLLGEIADDTRRQADSVVEVGRSVLEVDSASRAQVALVQATETTAEVLQEQSRVLTARVDRFRLSA